jgi:hypothetical protein
MIRALPMPAAIIAAALALLLIPPAQAAEPCGDVLTVAAHDDTSVRVAYLPAATSAAGQAPVTLALLPGGSGFVDLDEAGCPRALKGNSLVRSIPLFKAAGFTTALIDAPSDYQGEDGLEGFRVSAKHAQDLARVVAMLRERTHGAVWLVGTSRGTISAVNAAAHNTGNGAPDGLVLTSALMSGQPGARKSWVAHSVFQLPLEEIRMPLLLIGHAADTCSRSPPDQMPKVLARTRGTPQQMVTITGGPVFSGSSTAACEGRSPHGYLDQESEVADGIARFIRSGKY